MEQLAGRELVHGQVDSGLVGVDCFGIHELVFSCNGLAIVELQPGQSELPRASRLLRNFFVKRPKFLVFENPERFLALLQRAPCSFSRISNPSL